MNKVWFKAKRYGWGWYPASIEGWLMTAGLGLAVAGVAVVYERLSVRIDAGDTTSQIYAFILLVASLVGMGAGFVALIHQFGEKPRWRWGSKK